MLSLLFLLAACPTATYDPETRPVGPDLEVAILPGAPRLPEPELDAEWNGQLVPPRAPIPSEPPKTTIAPLVYTYPPSTPENGAKAETEAALRSSAHAIGPQP